MKSGWRLWLLRLGLSLGAIAFTLTLIELYVRHGTPTGEGAAFFAEAPSDLNVPYVLSPGADVRFEGHYVKIPATQVRISEQGLREDRTYAIPKPTSTQRVLVLGDSFVFGSGVELEDTFVKRWERTLAHIEIINFGVPGYTSTHAVELLAKRGLTFQPDAVVLIISDNDFYSEGSQRLSERRSQGDQWALRRFVDGRLQEKQKAESSWRHDKETVLSALRAALDRLQLLSEAHGFIVHVCLLFPHELEADIRTMGHTIHRLADAAYLRDMEALQIPRDLHPNAEGHARLADRLAATLPASTLEARP